MGEQFIGQITIMSFNFPPKGWALCNGQLLSIQQNLALFSLLGTHYGGNGSTTFGLPDMRGRVPIHVAPSYPQGAPVGSPAVTLTRDQLPPHNHFLGAFSQSASAPLPVNNVLAAAANLYRKPDGALTIVHPDTLSPSGGSQPHENMAPYLTLNFCIALQGVFPSKN